MQICLADFSENFCQIYFLDFPVGLDAHGMYYLQIFHTDLCTENPQQITVAGIWMGFDIIPCPHGGKFLS